VSVWSSAKAYSRKEAMVTDYQKNWMPKAYVEVKGYILYLEFSISEVKNWKLGACKKNNLGSYKKRQQLKKKEIFYLSAR